MACCKAEKFKWCADLETVEYEGQEYCIFHAPADCAEKQDVEAFNELVFQRIDEAKEVGKECNLRGTIFPGDISFSHYDRDNPLPEVCFEAAIFKKRANFIAATFSGNAGFNSATFTDFAAFGGTTFTEEAVFIDAVFKGYTSFYDVVFCGNAQFTRASFRWTTVFGLTHFIGNADFYSSVFSSYFGLNKVIFFGSAALSNTTFNGKVNITSTAFKNSASFNEAIFNKPSTFFDTVFSILTSFSGASFKADVHFRATKLERVDFSSCQFEKPVFFRETKFLIGNFDGCFINHRLEFDQADLSSVSFSGAPLENCRFINCIWPVSRGRRVVYDSRLVQNKGYYLFDNAENHKMHIEPPPPGSLADIFRRLKKIATAEQDHALASDWHFNEKDMVRRDRWLKVKEFVDEKTLRQILKAIKVGAVKKWRRFIELVREGGLNLVREKATRAYLGFDGRPLKSFFQNLFSGFSLELYRASSGYGERPFRAIFLLLAFVAAPIIFSSDPGGFIPLVQAKPSTTTDFWLPFAKGLWRLLITVQAGMFALAVRNRMRR